MIAGVMITLDGLVNLASSLPLVVMSLSAMTQIHEITGDFRTMLVRTVAVNILFPILILSQVCVGAFLVRSAKAVR
jgi:hypothetical protein